MHMASWFAVIEGKHDLQNPTSEEKIRLLGKHLNLNPQSRVLDVGAGRGGPALVLAQSYGCRVICVEQSEEFLRAAKERVKEAGVDPLVEFVHADGKDFPIGAESYDSALCLGATFIYGGLSETVTTLARGVKVGGFIAVGEPYWRRNQLPAEFDPEEGWNFLPLAETVGLFEAAGVEFVTLIASSQEDWDRYESLHWFTLEEWLRQNPDHPDANEFRKLGQHFRDSYLRWTRDLLDWAIFVGRKR
jgi:ubiquinone/menaquinone biosynthesis C-methylase UbiE